MSRIRIFRRFTDFISTYRASPGADVPVKVQTTGVKLY